MVIYTSVSFIKFYSLTTQLQMNLWILNWFKGNNSSTADDILMKLYVHTHVIMIHTYFKIYKVSVIDYLVAYFIDF